VETGPALGARGPLPPDRGDWPTYRHDAERSAASPADGPADLNLIWSAPVASPGDGPLALAWRARIASCLSAPVVAGGRVFAAATDEGRIVALDAGSGRPLWTRTLGGRLDSPPTVHEGICLVGCHDGWVYALRAKDGALAWRTRAAPWERRLVAYGQVESVWPAVGTVLVWNGMAFANAGRTTESDGGVALLALDPITGRMAWASRMEPGRCLMNDLLAVRDKAIGWHHRRFDPATGKDLPAGRLGSSQGGMLDGTWTQTPKKRSGNGFVMGRVEADLMAWNPSLVATPSYAISMEKALSPAPPSAASTVEQNRTGMPELPPGEKLWTVQPVAGEQVEAIAMTANAIYHAGRVTSAPRGEAAGFLRAFDPASGAVLRQARLAAPATYDGLAVAAGRLYVSLHNGALLCFGTGVKPKEQR
jgi:outer membrane protein assembly factor BamB